MEIERKFLLEDALILQLILEKNVEIFLTQVTQFYTSITKLNEVRYRKVDEKYSLTNKIGAGLVRDEFEVLIPKSEFVKAKKKRLSSIIKKSRYSFSINGFDYCLDVYQKELAPIVVLEVEFTSEQEAMSFDLRSVFDGLEFTEVTDDERYKNKYLSLFGNPEFAFDGQKAIEIHAKKPNLKLNFPPYINAYDGIRVLLNQFYINIVTAKNSFLQSGEVEALHQFRVGLRKSRSILGLCKELYDENICHDFCVGLKNIANETNEKRDLDVFIEYLDGIPGADELIYNLLTINQNHEKSTKELIKNPKTDEFFASYELFLDDEARFYASESSDIIFKKFIAQIIRGYVVRLARRLKSLNDDSINEEFHEVRIYFKKLRYILDGVGDMFDVRILPKCMRRTRAMQELFGSLQDRDIWVQILEFYRQTLYSDSQIYGFVSKLELDISRQIFEFRNEILEEKDKFIAILSSFSKILKAYY